MRHMEGGLLDHIKYYEYVYVDAGGKGYKQKCYECDDFEYEKYEQEI